MKKVFLAISLVGLVLLSGVRVMACIAFDQNCEGQLKQAADANTLDLAHERLSIAVDYATAEGLTEGYTSIMYKTPSDDIGFWYKNLTETQAKLAAAKNRELSESEEAQILDKVRETLIDRGDNGDEVTAPGGISIYPNNRLIDYSLWVFGIMFFFSGGYILVIGPVKRRGNVHLTIRRR